MEKYTNFTNNENLVKTTLSKLPRNDHLPNFSLCHVARNIVLTGGYDSDYEATAQTFLLAMQTGQWEQGSNPDLNIARRGHASMSLDKQCYVACGWGEGGKFLSSVEMLRLGAQTWELIKIPGLKPRYRPILSQIDSQSIAILGGRGSRG